MLTFQKLTIAALAVTLSCAAFGIGAAENPEWPEGAVVEVRLKLTAVVEKEGQLKITGELGVINPGNNALVIGVPTNRLALAFVVFDSLGNPVTAQLLGKSDPADTTRRLEPHETYSYRFEGLDFVTGGAWLKYDLVRAKLYHVLAVYRPAGYEGPGFASQEFRLQVPP